MRNADLLIVLKNGEIVGMGKHDELLTSCPEYQLLARRQFQREAENQELAAAAAPPSAAASSSAAFDS